MKITLIRHGETEDNFLNKLFTTTNCPMNDTGRRQCMRLKTKINNNHYDYCFTDMSIRCVETALILIGDVTPIIKDSRLNERYVGELEGRPYVEYNQYKYWDYDKNCGDNEVEKVKDLIDRCRKFINFIKKKYKTGNMMIVVDKEVYRALRHLLLKNKLEYNLLDGEIENCKIEEFEI